MPPKTLPKPMAAELASIEKSTDALTNQTRIGLVAGGYADAVLPQDNILRTKGNGDVAFYREVLRDDQVKSTFAQLRLAVVAAPWDVEPGAEDAESKACADALRTNLERIGWDRITDRKLYTLFYGYSVAECMLELRDNIIQFADVKVRDRARFSFGTKGELYLKRDGVRYERMPERKFWTCSTGADNDDEPYGMGLAHWLYWPVFFKRNGIKFWLIFLEKFGMPTAKVTAPAAMLNNDSQKAELLRLARQIQTDASILVPDGVIVELLEAARSGAVDYSSMCAAMDAAISKIVLTQTMTTDDGSSRAQGEVHERKGDKVAASAADLVCESFNNGPAKWFQEWNFPNAKPPRVWRNTEPAEDLTARAERDAKIKTLGFEPTEDYIRETYGEGWVKSQQADVLADSALQGDAGDNAQDFAEIAAIASMKAAHRNDQRAIVDASIAFANKAEQVVGERVRGIVAFAEQSGDFETMRARLNELAAEGPRPQTVAKLHRAGVMAHGLGARRGQR